MIASDKWHGFLFTANRAAMQVLRMAEQMTAERFREIVALLGWSRSETARFLGRDQREMRRWASGQNPVDAEAAVRLEQEAIRLGVKS